MAVNCEIIILSNGDATDSEEGTGVDDVLATMTDNYDVQIFNVIEINPVEIDITRSLLSACNRNESNVILIVGHIGTVERHFTTEAIRNVSDDKDFSVEVATSLLNIETKLNEIMPHKTTYGIRNQTLIIDLSGPHENAKICLETVGDLILYTVYLIRANEKENVPPHDVAYNNSVKLYNVASTKQKETKTVAKRRKKSSSPVDLLFSNMNESKRHKESFPMISVSDAQLLMHEVIADSINEMTPEAVQLSEAYGRVLCETVKSNYNVPPFRASTKNGYAVLVTDGKGLRKVLDEENTFPLTSLEPRTCVWVRTGGPIPDGATAVVQVMDTKVKRFGDNDDVYIKIMVQPEDGQNIKPIGDDLLKGKTVASPHKRIGPLEIALLAASGRKEVLVAKHVSIGVLSIGDNLEEPGKPLKSGYVYDINGLTLISLLTDKGFHPLDFGIVDNKLVPIRDKIKEALKKVDVLVTTGSTNDRDLLKTLLQKYYKANIHFGNVNMKPGKSTIFASCRIDDTKKYFLCLPGNPTSAFIAAQLFLLPLVNEMSSDFDSSQYTVIPARMEHQYTPHSRSRFAWTVLDWSDMNQECASAYSRKNAISDKLVSSLGANALLMLPGKETEKVLPKSILKALLINLPKRIKNKNVCNLRTEPLPTVKRNLSDRQTTPPPTNRYENILRQSLRRTSSPTRSCERFLGNLQETSAPEKFHKEPLNIEEAFVKSPELKDN